jgi:carbonic anhydrase/acetyltransferase-like protein (isoleucine patch superfamily)
MAYIGLYELSHRFPDCLTQELHRELRLQNGDSGAIGIDETAKFSDDVLLHKVGAIGARSHIHPAVILEDEVVIEDDVTIQTSTYLGRSVHIGWGAGIGPLNFFAEGSSLPHGPNDSPHQYLRQTKERVLVGPRVKLPSEAQIGRNAIIPTSATVAQIGRFGTSKRMVTVYGSDSGPLFGVGCQFGIDIDVLKKRVASSTDTSTNSAADYKKHMPEIETLGIEVQAAYDRESNLIAELIGQRQEILGKKLE